MGASNTDRIGDANRILWWIGWHPLYVILLGLVVVGLPVWLLGVVYVNFKSDSVLQDFKELVSRRREIYAQDLEADTELFTIFGAQASLWFLSLGSKYNTTHLLVGPSSVTIVEGLYMDSSTRIPYFRQQNSEVFYDQISSVGYENGFLQIRTSDGRTLRYASNQRPEGTLRTLRDRVRQYKKN